MNKDRMGVETTDLLKKVRKIEIKTRGLSRQVFAGQYHSAFKGRGMMFSEVREYSYGDDLRNIDWNVTARFNHPYIKVYEEERELTVMLLVDVSGSREFGTRTMLKRNMATEISAVLSFSAIQNNDKIGVIFFSDRVEKFVPPKKGRQHILRIIRELIHFQPDSSRTDLTEPLRFLTHAIKKRCTAFLISDFIDGDFEKPLRIASGKHDLVAIRIFDQRETELPPIGMVRMLDAETGQEIWVDSSLREVRENYRKWFEHRAKESREVFLRYGIDHVAIRTDEDYVPPLLKLFKMRDRS